MNGANGEHLGWPGIVRLGLVQMAIGAVVVLSTSTINRIMAVELALPAVLPGMLVALHYAVQMVRPRFGHGSDVGGRLTRWVIGGMGILATGGVAAAGSVLLMSVTLTAGIVAAVLAFALIGLGVGAAGTSLLVLLSKRVAPERRPAAATVTWVMMIAGFVVTTAAASRLLQPYSHMRLLELATTVSVAAWVISALAVWGIEMPETGRSRDSNGTRPGFRDALREVWHEPLARQFTTFVFISMLAYSGQELIFEPFAGAVLHLTPAQSAGLASLQHGGALAGMILMAVLGPLASRARTGGSRDWMTAGCIGSAVALGGLVVAVFVGSAWPLRLNVLCLGFANGLFTIAAITCMMALCAVGGPERRGIRMGLWGAAQAVAFAFGGMISSGAVDVSRAVSHSPLLAYAWVFAGQAVLFLTAGAISASLGRITSAVVAPERVPLEVAPAHFAGPGH